MPGNSLRSGKLGIRKLAIMAGLAGLLMTGGSAQQQPASRAIPRNAIDLATAKAIRPPSAEAIRTLEARVAAAPALEVAPGPVSTLPPPAAVAEVVPELEKGKLYHVDLAAADEKIIAKQLASQPAIQAQGSALVTLPGAFRLLATDGTELQLKPFVIPQKLSFNAATHMFLGSIRVGVQEIGGPAAPKKLTAPIPFQVLDDGIADPEELQVDHSGLPLSKIRISAAQAAGGLTVSVASPFNPEGVPVVLDLAPSFSLSVSKAFDGLGLEAATVAVSATGLVKPEGQIVQLTVDGPARAEEHQLRLDKDGRAATRLRSVGVGPTSVTAQLAGFPPAEASTMATLPVLTIVSSLLGGLVGGLIRLLPEVRRNTGWRFWLGLAVAILVGLLVFGLYAVGVNVLPFRPTVQIGAVFVFVVSAMGAYLGSGVLGAAKAADAG
jgi:hypothetical protein